MTPEQIRLVPAAAAGAAVLLPRVIPARRRLAVLAMTATKVWSDETRGEKAYILSLGGIPGLTTDQAHLVNRGLSAFAAASLALPVVEVARVLPLPRLLTAGAVALGYAVADSRVTIWINGNVARAQQSLAAPAQRGPQPQPQPAEPTTPAVG